MFWGGHLKLTEGSQKCWSKYHEEELQNMYSSANVIKMLKIKMINMYGIINAGNILSEKGGKIIFQWNEHRWYVDININIQGIRTRYGLVRYDAGWDSVVGYSEHGSKPLRSIKRDGFLASWESIPTSRYALRKSLNYEQGQYGHGEKSYGKAEPSAILPLILEGPVQSPARILLFFSTFLSTSQLKRG